MHLEECDVYHFIEISSFYRYYTCHLFSAMTDRVTENVCWFYSAAKVSDRVLQPNSWIVLPLLTGLVQMMLMLVNAIAHGLENRTTLKAVFHVNVSPLNCHSVQFKALCSPVFSLKLQWKLIFQILTLSSVLCLWGKGLKYVISILCKILF